MDLADAPIVWLGNEARIVDVLTLDHADVATYPASLGQIFNDLRLGSPSAMA